MAKAYYICVKGGTRLYSQVPAKYVDAVNAYLLADVEAGVLTLERYEELISM